jgi:two-component system, sensor histidine kinase
MVRLQQATSNLLSNALKFSADDVTVSVTFKDEKLKLQVTDKGIGIPEEHLDSIFQPFSSPQINNKSEKLQELREKKGTDFNYGVGISLSITKKIM